MKRDLFFSYPCTVLVRLGAFWGAFPLEKCPSTLLPTGIYVYLWLASQAHVASQEIAGCQARE